MFANHTTTNQLFKFNLNKNKRIFYQIYPLSFYDYNNDGCGDFQGIINRLAYLKKLGVNVLWLRKIFVYDPVTDYQAILNFKAVDERLGSIDKFQQLVIHAKKLGLEVMIDLELRGTSINHLWFQAALKYDPSFRNFYVFSDGKETNQRRVFNQEIYEKTPTGDYYKNSYCDAAADFKWDDRNLISAMAEIITFWIKKGVTFFNFCDVEVLGKNHTLIKYLKKQVYNLFKIKFTAHKILELIKFPKKKLTFCFSSQLLTPFECQKLVTSLKFNYYICLSHLAETHDQTFGHFKPERWDFAAFRKFLLSANHSASVLFFNSLGYARFISYFFPTSANNNRNYLAKAMLLLAFFLPGHLGLYQGDELGMSNFFAKKITFYSDQLTIKAKHYFIDQTAVFNESELLLLNNLYSPVHAQLAMQWENNHYAGFNKTALLPKVAVHPDYFLNNVAAQNLQADSTLRFWLQLLAFFQAPNHQDFCQVNHLELIFSDQATLLAFTKLVNKRKLVFFFNLTDSNLVLKLPMSQATVLFNNYPQFDGLNLVAYQALLLLFG